MIDLRIQQTWGKIGLDIKDANFDLNIKKPEIKINQAPPQIQMTRTDPDIEIDYSPMLESIGYGGIEYIKNAFVEQAKSDYIAGLEKSVAMGESFAAIENKLSVAEIVSRFNESPYKDLTIQPIAAIRIYGQPGTLNLETQPGDVSVDVDYGKVTVDNYQFPAVRVYLEQRPELKIEAVGQIFDQKK